MILSAALILIKICNFYYIRSDVRVGGVSSVKNAVAIKTVSRIQEMKLSFTQKRKKAQSKNFCTYKFSPLEEKEFVVV